MKRTYTSILGLERYLHNIKSIIENRYKWLALVLYPPYYLIIADINQSGDTSIFETLNKHYERETPSGKPEKGVNIRKSEEEKLLIEESPL